MALSSRRRAPAGSSDVAAAAAPAAAPAPAAATEEASKTRKRARVEEAAAAAPAKAVVVADAAVAAPPIVAPPVPPIAAAAAAAAKKQRDDESPHDEAAFVSTHRDYISARRPGRRVGASAAFAAAAEPLRRRLLRAAAPFGCRSVDVIGRSRGVALVVEKDHVQEELEVEFGGGRRRKNGEESSSSCFPPPPPRRSLRYRQTEGSFSQPNGRVCEAMLGWAWKAALGRSSNNNGGEGGETLHWRRNDDLLELYCGNGNFTAALAPAFRRVVATEVSRSGVASAAVNLKENGSEEDDVVVARADADRVAAALAALDKRSRGEGEEVEEEEEDAEDKDAEDAAEAAAADVFAGVVPTSLGGNADLSTYDLRTLFVDPPRAGVGPVTQRVMRRFDRVLYVSCNPESLAADVAALVNGVGVGGGGEGDTSGQNGGGTHEVTAAAVFDQFPYTDHIECGLLLERKKKE